MTPVLFISIVTLVLVLLVYWILSNLEKRPPEFPSQRNKARFETSQELFKYLDQDPGPEKDLLELEHHEEQLHLLWHMSSLTWQLTRDKYAPEEDPPSIVIRIFDPYSRIMDIPVQRMQGQEKVKTGSFKPIYGVLGVQVKGDFIPLFLSHPLH